MPVEAGLATEWACIRGIKGLFLQCTTLYLFGQRGGVDAFHPVK